MKELKKSDVVNSPYPHVVINEFTSFGDQLEIEFPKLELFGNTIRMDGDLNSNDDNFKKLNNDSRTYASINEYFISKKFIENILDAFDEQIEEHIKIGELLIDPRDLEISETCLEARNGSALIEFPEPKLFSRIDIGYAGKAYGINNGGKGIHTDNRRRLFSCLLYINTPKNIKGGEHRMYQMHENYSLKQDKSYTPKQDLFLASLQSNYAFHDVNPITEIEGYRKAIYIGVTCSNELWKKIDDVNQAKLTQNRYTAPPTKPKSKSLISKFLLKIFK
ncbi:2OG-Fe(II) oxygenase [Flavicella marina]|uniref:2OG-Fe(II) oxygenase n=1 Tax=Flavicella marina TaxID=1475951 RepID=UPI0012648209|nr:2OG-Fe(II) oxygenase [Flavicella marina]